MYLMDGYRAKSFRELGFAGPFRLIDTPVANSLTKVLSRAKSRMFFWHRVLSRVPLMNKRFPVSRWGTAKWIKGIHAVNGEVYRLGADRRVVDHVSQILGPDVLLCGSIMINQRPGAFHRWHSDVEHRDWNGLTVWVALANVSMKSTLRIITRSQRIPLPPPADLKDELVLAEAQRHDPACRELVLPAEPGQFYLLAGPLWHSSWNESSKTRYALIFDYCRTDVEVRWPVRDRMKDWVDANPAERVLYKVPFKLPCCLVSGEDRHQKNLLVKPPL